MRDIQQSMQRMLDRMVEEGRERGVQLAAYYRGELIVDAWAGIADSRTGRAVDGRTLFPVFSTSKGIAATVLHILAEQKKLDYDMPIRELWPEFGTLGKERATIRHALSHMAGIPQMPADAGVADVLDWDGMCAKIASLVPQWEPGEHMEYHAITYGWIVGEIARRADGRPFSRIMVEEICEPLGIQADLFIGIPDAAVSRVAFLEEPGYVPPIRDVNAPQPIPEPFWPLHDWMNGTDTQRACIPASNGVMTAKAIARHYAALLPGGAGGVELLPPSRMKLATEPQLPLDGPPPISMGLGYWLWPGAESSPASFGHGGYGGSMGFADPAHHLAVGYTNNLYSPKSSGADLIQALRNALE